MKSNETIEKEQQIDELMKDSFINNEGFIKYNGYEYVCGGLNKCVLESPITKESLNPYGIPHGGFIFGLADTAAGMAASSTGRPAVTINSNIQYLKASKGDKLIATASCIKHGKTISVYQVDITDNRGSNISTAVFTYYYID